MNAVWRLVSAVFATFLSFGEFVIVSGSEGEFLEVREFCTAEQLVVLVLYMDVMTACVLSSDLSFLFSLPVAGGKLKFLVDDGQFNLQSNRWMKRATFFGAGGICDVPAGCDRKCERFDLWSTVLNH
ncbi:MAG: hypothetical protein ACK526_04585 [Planctomyces sp.]|jgi:hypothetical protein